MTFIVIAAFLIIMSPWAIFAWLFIQKRKVEKKNSLVYFSLIDNPEYKQAFSEALKGKL